MFARDMNLTIDEKRQISQQHYDEWFKKAKGFLKCFGYVFKEGEDYPLAAFQLQQSAEAAYKAILLVVKNYCPHEHFLGVLGPMAVEYCADLEKEYSTALKKIFPQETKEKQDQFENFDYAYIGGRYDPRYKISVEELRYFSERVQCLLELTETICQKALTDGPIW